MTSPATTLTDEQIAAERKNFEAHMRTLGVEPTLWIPTQPACGYDNQRVSDYWTGWSARAILAANEAAPAAAPAGSELERLRAIVAAPRGTEAQILKERELTASAISGALAFGHQGVNPPPSDDHWLAPFWRMGREFASSAVEAGGSRASPHPFKCKHGQMFGGCAICDAPSPSVTAAAAEGWKLVPVEPTPEMIEAGRMYAECAIHGNAVFAYRAMLAASPSVEGVGSEADQREKFEAAMRSKHPEWAFTADPVFDYHNERTRCAWEGWQAALAAPAADRVAEALEAAYGERKEQ